MVDGDITWWPAYIISITKPDKDKPALAHIYFTYEIGQIRKITFTISRIYLSYSYPKHPYGKQQPLYIQLYFSTFLSFLEAAAITSIKDYSRSHLHK